MGIKRLLKDNLPLFLLEPMKGIYGDIHYVAMHMVPEAWYLKWHFKRTLGYPLNLDNPRTFNEKLQWLKLHDRKTLYTKMVDKYEVKQYVAELIGDDYIIPTLGVWNHFDEIDFDKLPNEFVLKCTHDSGSTVICTDKKIFDKNKAKKVLERAIKHNFYYKGGFEWPYKNVKPRIIAEKYMIDRLSDGLTDYKLMCFNGKVECTFTCTGRNSERGLHVTFYDREWRKMPFARHYPVEKEPMPKPKNYEKMVRLAETLATQLNFARIDFYDINENVFFGEITFFPGNGYEEFTPKEWDYKIGDWLNLK